MIDILGYVVTGLLTIANSLILFSLNKRNRLEEKRALAKEQDEEDRLLYHQGLQFILYFTIKNEALRLLQQDVVEYHEYEFLSRIHNIYHKFGGNGDLDHLMQSVFERVVQHR